MASFIYIPTAGGGSAASSVSGTPTITGVKIVGQTLTADVSGVTVTGSPTPTVTYQWYRGTVAIPSATNLTYVLQAADAGESLTFRLTATNSSATTYVVSAIQVIFLTIADKYSTSASFGWAVFLLRGAYYSSPILRVRRTSDNTEKDFYAGEDGRLKVTGTTSDFISNWCGSSEGFVTVLYDQLGSSNLTQTTTTSQFRIWTGTAAESVGSPATNCMSSRVQSTPSSSSGGIMSVVGSAAAGTFNFLHDGTSVYSLYSVATNVGTVNMTNSIVNTMTGNAIGFQWNFNGANVSGQSGSVLRAYNATPALTISSSLNTQIWLDTKTLYLSYISVSYSLLPAFQRVRGGLNRYNYALNNQGNTAGGTTPSLDFTIGGLGGSTNTSPHQFVALLIYKTETDAYQTRNALATLTNLT